MADTAEGFQGAPVQGCQCPQLCTCKQDQRPRPRFLNLAKRSFTNIRLIRSPKSPPESIHTPITPPEESRISSPNSALSSPGPRSAAAIETPTMSMESLLHSPSPRSTPVVTRKPLPNVVVPPTKPFAYYDTPEQTPTMAVRRDSSPVRKIKDFGVPASKPIQKRSFSLVPETTPRMPMVARPRGQSMDQSKAPLSIPRRKPVPIRTDIGGVNTSPRIRDENIESSIEETLAWLENEQYESPTRGLSQSPVSPLSEKADEVLGSPEYTPLPLQHDRVLPGISGFPSFSSGSTLSSSPSFTSQSTATSVESRSKTPPPFIAISTPRIPSRKPVSSPSTPRTPGTIPRKAVPKRRKTAVTIHSLPDDIILTIISHLPSLNSIASAQLVNRRFDSIISSNLCWLIETSNPSAYNLIQILYPEESNFESFKSAYISCLGIIDGLISRIRRRCPGLLRREMLDTSNKEEIGSMRLALWNIWCYSLLFSANFSNSEESVAEQRRWLARFGRRELFAMIEMCGLLTVLLRPLLEIAYSVELTDKFRKDAYFDDQPLDIKERYDLIENLLGFLRTVGLDHIYELSSIFGSSETAASPMIIRNIAADYIIENMLIETWERDLGREYSSFMVKPMKELHLELEKESRRGDLDGRRAREGKGWGPGTPGNDDEELVSE